MSLNLNYPAHASFINELRKRFLYSTFNIRASYSIIIHLYLHQMESIKQFLSTKYRLSTSNGFFSFFQNKFSMNSRRRSKIESVRIQQKAKCPEAPAFTSKSLAEINEKFNDCQYGMIYQHVPN